MKQKRKLKKGISIILFTICIFFLVLVTLSKKEIVINKLSSLIQERTNLSGMNGHVVTRYDMGIDLIDNNNNGIHYLKSNSGYTMYCGDKTKTLKASSTITKDPVNLLKKSGYNTGPIKYLIDNIVLDGTLCKGDRIWTLEYMNMTRIYNRYGKTFKLLGSDEIYAVMQQYIWSILNGEIDSVSVKEAGWTNSMQEMLDLFYSESVQANNYKTVETYSNQQPNGITVTSDTAKLNATNGLIGPFQVNTYGKIYGLRADLTMKIGNTTTTPSYYFADKNGNEISKAACLYNSKTYYFDTWDIYNKEFYIKLKNVTFSDGIKYTVNVNFDGFYYNTYVNWYTTTSQPMLKFGRTEASINGSWSGSYSKTKNGKYSLNIVKKSKSGAYLAGTTFSVNNKTYTSNALSTGIHIVKDKAITSTGADTYEIKETTPTSGYKKGYDGVLQITINKEEKNLEYKVTSYQVKIKPNGQTTYNNYGKQTGTFKFNNISITFDSSTGTITVTYTNEEITGTYGVNVKKVNAKSNSAISGVKFKVKSIKLPNGEITTSATNTSGLATIGSDIQITKNNVNSTDSYTISEIDLGNNTGIVKLKNAITIYVSKGLDSTKTKYIATSAKFLNSNEAKNNGREITQKVELGDGTTADAKLQVYNGIVTITIPNAPITGTYDINVKKVNSKTQSAIAGVKFKVKLPNGEITTEATNASGLATIASQVPITQNTLASDKYEISEVDLGNNTGIVKLKNELTIYVKKGLNSTGTKYIATKANFIYGYEALNNGKEITQEVELEDGTTANVKLKVDGGNVIITIPNGKQGKYRLNIGKKSANSQLNVNNNSDFMAGAEFEVKQYLDVHNGRSTNIAELGTANYSSTVTSVQGSSTPVTMNKKTDFEIKDISTIDVYKIKETKAPKGFQINNNEYYLKVYKQDGNPTTTISKVDIGMIVNNQEKLIKSDISGVYGDVNNRYGIYVDTTNATIAFAIADSPKIGTYNFKLTKTDISKKIIKSEKTKFDVNIYSTMAESNGKVTFSNPITLKKSDGTQINTKGITATTGETTGLNGISIQSSDIGKTYYFVTTETQAPDNYTAINYKVVVPITYSENDTSFVATKGNAFAVTSSGEKKTLAQMSTNVNEVVSTEQTDVTINVNIPNKPKEGLFNFQLTKYIEGTKTPLSGAKFTVKITDENGTILKDTNGNSIDGTKKYTTGSNGQLTEEISGLQIDGEGKTYKIDVVETDPPTDYIGAEPISFTARSQYNTSQDGYILKTENPVITNTKANATITSNLVSVEYYNTPKEGSFNFELIKYKEGSTVPLGGAKFKVKIYEIVDGKEVIIKDKDGNAIDGTREYITGDDGRLTTPITGLKIGGAGKTYNVNLTETNPPANYLGIGTVTFTAETEYSSDNSSYILKSKEETITNKAKVSVESGLIKSTIYNTPKSGSFDFNLVKYIKGQEKTLTGAGFKIKIANKQTNQTVSTKDGVVLDGTKEYLVDKDGKISIPGIIIEKDQITYTVTITETTVPQKYIGLAGPISFEAKTIWNEASQSYKLVANKSTTIKNAKLVDVKEGEILVETENIPEPEIHKGVKDVKNQDSGYYSSKFGDVEHDWVINSTIPKGISEFTEYVITDTIDNRLVFSGLDKVKVKVLNGKELQKDVDYKVSYDSTTRLLKISFIDGSFIAGRQLPEGATIEVRFKTTFALNEDGVPIALINNQQIPNTALLKFNNGSGEKTKPSETPQVHTGGIKVFKYENVSGKKVPLEGAIFKIATSEENARNNVFIKVKDANGKETQTDVTGKSNKDGIAVFPGLEFGGDAMSNEANKKVDAKTGAEVFDYDFNNSISSKYWIVETEAPKGYIKWDSPVEVTITKDSYNVEVSNMPSVENTTISGKYVINLNKVKQSDNSPLKDATFEITSNNVSKANRTVTSNADGLVDVTNGEVTIVSKQSQSADADKTYYNSDDLYTIKETVCNSYLKLKNSITLNVHKEEVNKEYKVTRVTITELNENNSVTLNVSDSNNTVVLKNVKLVGNKGTVNITLSLNNNNISITVPNKEIEGEYNIKLLKKDSNTGDDLPNIPFTITSNIEKANRAISTDSNGIIDITNGTIKITKNSLSNDTFTIQENEDNNNKDYSIIAKPIVLNLTKGENAEGTAYIVKQVAITYTSNLGESSTTMEIDPNSNTGTKSFSVLTKDGQLVLATITASSSGEIILNIGNPNKEGSYRLRLYKSIINNNGEEKDLAGINFKLYKSENGLEYSLKSSSNGFTNKIASRITKENKDIVDTWTINEVESADDKIIQLKNSLKLEVTKKINNDNNGYVINTIKLSENGTSNSTQELVIDETNGGTTTLPGVQLLDGRVVDITIGVTEGDLITVKIPNRTMTGKYTIRIKKVNSVTGEAINGVTFKGIGPQKVSFEAVTQNDGTEDGIAIIAKDVELNEIVYHDYLIREFQLPDNLKGELLQITDYDLGVNIGTKMNDDKTAYVLDYVHVTPYAAGGSATTAAQKAIIEKTTYEEKDNVITITMYNEPTVDYSFKIKKVNMKDKSISKAKFTVIENGSKILNEQELGDSGEYLIDRENQPINTMYRYEIYETQAAEGYDNILEKIYLTVDIIVDSSGNVTSRLGIVPNYSKGGTVFDRIIAQRKLMEYSANNGNKTIFKNNGNNSYTLNIPNPTATTDINLLLNKHELNGTAGVDGAVFGVRKIHVAEESSVNLTNIINKFQAGTDVEELTDIVTSKSNTNIQIDSLKSVNVNDSYYYEIYEKSTPHGYMKTYDKIIVRAHANTDKTITSDILAIMNVGADEWEIYNTTEDGNSISLTKDGNNIKVNWANKVYYVVQLFKKQYSTTIPKKADGSVNWSGLQGINGATFTIKQIEPVEHTFYEEQVIGGNISLVNSEASTNTKYHYEFIEHAAKDGYTNIFEGIKIHLYVTIGNDGIISTAKNETYYELEGNMSADKKKYLEDKIGIEIDENMASLYIANEEKTLSVALMKVGKSLVSEELVGIPGIVFNILDKNKLPVKDENGNNPETDKDGYIYINGLDLGTKETFVITEESVPPGVTLLKNTQIILEIDTTNITDPTQITDDRMKVSLSQTGAGGVTSLEGLSVNLQGSTVVLTVPNPITTYTLNMFKYDEIGNIINNADGIKASEFKVTKGTISSNSETIENEKNIFNGELKDGRLLDYDRSDANKTYVYKFEEQNPKAGYFNVLEGWDLYVYATTNANAILEPTQENGIRGRTRFELKQKDENITPKYSLEEIIKNKYIKMSTNIGETSGTISLSIINPYGYKLKINKKDLNGNEVKKASILAERLENVRAEDLSLAANSYDEDTVQSILKECVESTNVSKSILLNKEPTIISEPMEIKNNIGISPKDNTAQIWRITETDVESPYVNILGDNSIIVQTIYRENALHVIEHGQEIDGIIQSFKYYVVNKNGEDVTSQYSDYVEVSTEKVDNQYNLVVTVKDPAKFYIDLNKAEYMPDTDAETEIKVTDMQPLSGAELTISSSFGNADITNGETKSELIECEVNTRIGIQFDIEETSTAPNHRNILKDKILRIYAVVYDDGSTNIVYMSVLDKTNNQFVPEKERNEIFKYVKFFSDKTSEGYPIIHVYVENPVEYKFKLAKQDAAGNPLIGTEIEVESSHSGMHYIDGESDIEFIEEGLKPGDVIQYNVREVRTVENSAYVNKFEAMTIILYVDNEGEVKVNRAFMTKSVPGSHPQMVPLKDVDFVDYDITAPDADGTRTLLLTLQNPTKIDIELQKKQAGNNGGVIANTEFKIVSSFSDEHTKSTDKNGKINFTEDSMRPGNYTYRIYENRTANPNYANVLEGIYMKVDINVSPEGNITINNTSYYYQDEDDNYENDRILTDAKKLEKLQKYTSVQKVIEEDNPVQKLLISIINPVTIRLEVTKVSIAGQEIEGTKFNIISELDNRTINESTDDSGKIYIDEGWVDPGIYKYEVIEEETAGPQYYNVLKEHKVVAYVKVSESGETSLVADKNGTEFAYNEKYKYYIERLDGEPVDTKDVERIQNHVRIAVANISGDPDEALVHIENTLNYKMNIIKKNSAGNDISGTRFTVIRDKNAVVLSNAEITTAVEITEEDMKDGLHIYDITENNTVENSAYMNILQNRFIRAYVDVREDGSLRLKDDEDNISINYFEIYEGNINDSKDAKLLDRAENADLYNLIKIGLEKDNNGIYTINLQVENPIQIDVEIQKKQVGTNGTGIQNTVFTITRDEDNDPEEKTTDEYGKISFNEKGIKPGDYTYTVKEVQTASDKYINILENKYLEVHISISEDGLITIKNHEIYNSDGTKITDINTLEKLNKYISINVDSTNPVEKLIITIYNPVTLDLYVYKENIEGDGIDGTNFTIKRTLVNTSNIKIDTEDTKNSGVIELNEGWVTPGVYKYEVTENNTSGNQYINVLENCKLVIYVKVSENGDVKIVSNKDGDDFAPNVKYKYYIENDAGTVVNEEIQKIIHKYIKLTSMTVKHDEIDLTVINPVSYKLNIIKKDQRNNNLSGTKFSVMRDNNIKVLDNVDITTETELTEQYLEAGEHIYYITENSTKPGYINILKGKFIKVYTDLDGKGTLKIKDSEFNTNDNYFELYEGSIDDINKSALLDRQEYADLYNLIAVNSVENDGVYTLNVDVKNPDITYDLILNKKIFGGEQISLMNTKFTIISEFSGRHANLFTDKDGNISIKEERVPAGIYKYLITETRTSGNQFINVLKDNMYIVIYLKVNEDGTIEIVNENGEKSDNTYYLYKQEDDSNLMTKINLDDVVIDEFIKVGTSTNNNSHELNVYIKNPEYYNFELIKKDKDTKEAMNGVEFTLRVYNQDDEMVTLKDAETLEELVKDKLVTKNVNGIDGVISIPKILIEKRGTYTFVLHEESTEGLFNTIYKSLASDIRIDVEIVVENGEYIVKNMEVPQGGKYVEVLSISNSKAQTSQVEVVNERVKGEYKLVIDKLDSYTNRTLNGAEFDITVEKDGQNYELYEVTDDVTENQVIIPTHVTVNEELILSNIRIERPETYTIILTETKAPDGYMLLDKPIKIEVTTARSGSYDDEKFIVDSIKLIDDQNHGLVSVDNEDEKITITAQNEYFDLALRKSITSVQYANSDDAKITEDETKDRVPEVITTDLLDNIDTTADYNHVKNHVRAYASQEVIYTLKVYNEGEIDGYAEEITDHLPVGLEFVDDDFNKERGWKLDPEDPTLKTVRTTYLSKENNPNNDKFNSEKNLIKAMDKVTGELDYKEIQIKCKISDDVKAKTVLTNIAEISRSKANNRTSETIDRDSVTNNVEVPETPEEMSNYQEDNLTDDRNTYIPGQEDDDDFEKLIVEEFDLALRKYIVAVNDEELVKQKTDDEENKQDTEDKENNQDTEDEENNQNTEDETDIIDDNDTIYEREPIVNVDSLKDGSSTTATYTHTKEPVEVSVGDIVTYTLEVFNEGTISGYASLIKDDIPEGLEFVTYTEGDGSTNDIYRWKMVDENDNEVTDPKKAKYVISDYLSKDNEFVEEGNLINAYDPATMATVDSKFVKVAFRVICKQDWPKVIKNQAQISEDSDEGGKGVKDRDSTTNKWLGEDDEDEEFIRVTYMDLALRKFITGVNDKAVTERIPQVDATSLINETGTTASYTHPKDPVLVHTTDVVTYTIRVYNEGSKDGYATGIKDDIPDGLVFLPDNETNKKYGWKLVDENDKEVTDVSKAKYVVTNYLSKDNETEEGQNLMKAFDKEKMKIPDFRDVKIAFKVVEPTTSDRILINYAQISEQTDGKGIHREDRDSVPNEWRGEDDEDIEKVRVQYFDLTLRKWVTKAIVIQDGKTNVTETGHHAEDDPEEVVKVDLKKSKIDSVVVKFEYQIRITNEGEIAGYAKEIKDHIPEGLIFDAADNPSWVQVEDRIITTDQLKDTLLQPGESAEVTVVLTWVNSKTNMGVKVNIAEISKDYNEYGTPDIDSTPNNFVEGEDDIDDAPVMLTIKTGSEYLRYMAITLGVLAILGLGVSLIKDEVKRKK